MTNNTFTIRELTKRGFERRKDLDFRDDGNAFKCLTYKGFKVTYLKSDNQYYLSIDIDWQNRAFTFDEVKRTDWYELIDEFNGCKNVDVDKFISNFDIIINGINELTSKVEAQRPDVEELQRYLNKEIELAEAEVAYFKANYNWYKKASSISIKFDVSRVNRLENAIINAKTIDYSKMNNKQLREVAERIEHYHVSDYNLDGRFVFDLCKEN